MDTCWQSSCGYNIAEQETSTFSLSFYAVFEIGKMRILTMYLNHNPCDDPYPKTCSDSFGASCGLQRLMIQLCPESCLILQLLPESCLMLQLLPESHLMLQLLPESYLMLQFPISASEDSDVEIVCVRPGKRPRVGEGILKVEPLMKSLLPVGSQVKLERAVKSEPSIESGGHQAPKSKFCPQGHAAVFKQQAVSTSTTVVRRRQKHWVHTDKITCDVCKTDVASGAWRCDRCNWDACEHCMK